MPPARVTRNSPSFLTTPPVPRSPSRSRPSRAAPPFHIDPPSHASSLSQTAPTAPTSRVDLSSLIDPTSDWDDTLVFVTATLSHSAFPTIPTRDCSHSPLPTTSNFPTSIKSGSADDNQNQASEYRFIVPAGYDTSIQFVPVLVSRPRANYLHPPPPYYAPSPPPGGPRPVPPQAPQPHRPRHDPSGPIMSGTSSAGLVAMPSARSSRAPHFSGSENDVLTEFLREYEDLADGFGLTEEQKVETILRYVPRTLRSLWTTLPGYQAGDWGVFREDLKELYPDVAASRHTKRGLEAFRALSAKHRVRDEAEVLKYYRNFLTVAPPLLELRIISIEDYNTAFFRGFHPSVQDVIAERFKKVYPHHPVEEPFPAQAVLEAARRHFSSNQFHRRGLSHKGKAHDKHRSHSKHQYSTPDAFIQRTYGTNQHRRWQRSHTVDSDSEDSDTSSDSENDSGMDTSFPEYGTKSVRFKCSHSSRSRAKENGDPLSLVTKLHSLSVHEPSYLVLYTQCQKRFPLIAQNLPKPQLLPAASTPASALTSVSYQSTLVAIQPPLPQPYPQPQLPVPPVSVPAPMSAPATDPKAVFFGRYGARTQGCAFCGELGHWIHACPTAEEYVDTGHVRIINRRLYLPTGQPIPNDGHNLGLKAGVDAWLAANPQYPSITAVPTTQRDPPPHAASFSFEVIPDPTAPTGAYITEADADSDIGGDDTYPTELYSHRLLFNSARSFGLQGSQQQQQQDGETPPSPSILSQTML